ncbi:uncharacterized protein LOC144770849 [Lissotriton helveticus]
MRSSDAGREVKRPDVAQEPPHTWSRLHSDAICFPRQTNKKGSAGMEEGKHAHVLRKVALAGMLMAVLLAQGNALSCSQCISTSSSCSGPSVPCPSAGDQCMSKLTETIIAGAAQGTLFSRTCGASSECNQVASQSDPNMSVKISSTCCATDNCTPPQPIFTFQ